MPSEIINSIGQASGAVAASQLPTNQIRGAESATTPTAQLQQTRAAAEVSATQAQTDQQRTIQRDTKRSEGGFSGQERPKDSQRSDAEPQETTSPSPRSEPGRLSRVA